MEYVYYCNSCNKEKSINHSIKENPIIKCDCNNEMKRKITGGLFVKFNGDGFTKRSA